MSKCIIFSAPSGSGKTTIVKHLLEFPELKLEFSISACSRLPREGEQHGKDYYFFTSDEFRANIENGNFIEWEEVYNNNFYGTLKSEIDRIWAKGNHVIFDVDVKGGLNLKKIFGNSALAIFIQPPSIEVLEQRLRHRGTETEDKIKQRLSKAEFELSFANQFDVVEVNESLQQSVKNIYDRITAFIKE
jgi:guanylate kinase